MKKINKNQPSFPPLFRGKALPLKKSKPESSIRHNFQHGLCQNSKHTQIVQYNFQ